MSSAALDSAITQDDHGAARGCLHPSCSLILGDCRDVLRDKTGRYGTASQHQDARWRDEVNAQVSQPETKPTTKADQ